VVHSRIRSELDVDGTVIRAEGLHKVFVDARGEEVHAVRGVSFEAHGGEILGILGPNGAGKTTLLRMLASIIQPTRGAATVCGFDVVEQADEVKRRIGFLSGNTKLYARLSAAETVRYFGRLTGLDDETIRDRTDSIFASLDMEDIRDRRFEKLSTGQKQKVSIARTLIHDPPVLILDEPTAGLDVIASRAIVALIRQAKAQDKTVLLSTHYMTEAEELCDRIALLHEGVFLAVDTLERLVEHAGTTGLNEAFFRYLEDAGAAAPAGNEASQ
jgi:sodium transport system ATP-binding protein